jgi:hypothetical protein
MWRIRAGQREAEAGGGLKFFVLGNPDWGGEREGLAYLEDQHILNRRVS